jgi:IS5 family transposase
MGFADGLANQRAGRTNGLMKSVGSSIWRFRRSLERRELSDALFAEIDGQPGARGSIVHNGTLIDVTIVKAAVRPSSFEWTIKNDDNHFGYKARIGFDRDSGLIRDAILTSTDLHGSMAGSRLAQSCDGEANADAACDSAKFRDVRKARSRESRIAGSSGSARVHPPSAPPSGAAAPR